MCAVLLASGCASFSPLPQAGAGDAFAGRLAIRVEAIGREPVRAFSAAFDLRGDSRSGALALSTPLGSTLAQAQWGDGDVVLVTPQSRRRFDDLDHLTQEVLGESIPVAAWFDWLRGRPWPGAPNAGETTGTTSFEQLGWAVDTSHLAEGRVVAVRERPAPKVTVRIQLDQG
ncbi:MAG: lipoprotein insertase outer membrane protein LolB [Caldimonas sp.]